jgi:hypothetical protein
LFVENGVTASLDIDLFTISETNKEDGAAVHTGEAPADDNKQGDDVKTKESEKPETEQTTTIEYGQPANGQPSGIRDGPLPPKASQNPVLFVGLQNSFLLPQAKIPGGLLIAAATINMLCISFSVHVGSIAIEFYVALLVYASAGILGCLVGFPQKNVRRQNGFGITCAILSSLVAGMSIAQVGL